MYRFCVGIVLGWAVFQSFTIAQQQAAPIDKNTHLPSQLVRSADAVPTRGEWGHWGRYFRGKTPAMQDLVVLAVTLEPGAAPHPPHRHAEEELMFLPAGEGIWTLDDKELDARAGDVVYAAPDTLHGLRNTSKERITYYMVKWQGKGGAEMLRATDQSSVPHPPADTRP